MNLPEGADRTRGYRERAAGRAGVTFALVQEPERIHPNADAAAPGRRIEERELALRLKDGQRIVQKQHTPIRPFECFACQNTILVREYLYLVAGSQR